MMIMSTEVFKILLNYTFRKRVDVKYSLKRNVTTFTTLICFTQYSLHKFLSAVRALEDYLEHLDKQLHFPSIFNIIWSMNARWHKWNLATVYIKKSVSAWAKMVL